MYLYGVVGLKEGCNLTPFLLPVGLSVSLTHRLGQLPYPGPLPEHQRKRPQLKEPFFLLFSCFFSPPSPNFFPVVVSNEVGPCAFLLIVLFFLITQTCAFDHLILKKKKKPSHLSFMTISHIIKKKQNPTGLITLFSKAAQVCDNRWVETLKQAKSSLSRLATCGLCLRPQGPAG